MSLLLKQFLTTGVICCLLFAGCGRQNQSLPPTEPSPPPPIDAPSATEDTIDPLEEAARLRALPPDLPADESSPTLQEQENPIPVVSEPIPPASPSRQPEQNTFLESGAPEQAVDAPLMESTPFSAPTETSQTTPASPIERELLTLINDERQLRGLEPLGIEEAMQQSAELRAQEALQGLSHTRPNGSPYHTVFDESGFAYAGKWHGENLAVIQVSGSAYDNAAVAASLFAEWKKSSGHHQNMVNENFFQTGIGVYIEQQTQGYRIGSAQLFAGI